MRGDSGLERELHHIVALLFLGLLPAIWRVDGDLGAILLEIVGTGQGRGEYRKGDRERWEETVEGRHQLLLMGCGGSIPEGCMHRALAKQFSNNRHGCAGNEFPGGLGVPTFFTAASILLTYEPISIAIGAREFGKGESHDR